MPLPTLGAFGPSGNDMSIDLGSLDGSRVIVTSCFLSLTVTMYLSPLIVRVVPSIFSGGTCLPSTSKADIVHSPWSLSKSFLARSAGLAAIRKIKDSIESSARFIRFSRRTKEIGNNLGQISQ